MIFKELQKLIDYEIPIIEIENSRGELEYIVNLDELNLSDITIMHDDKMNYYGKITLKRKRYGKKKTYFIQETD